MCFSSLMGLTVSNAFDMCSADVQSISTFPSIVFRDMDFRHVVTDLSAPRSTVLSPWLVCDNQMDLMSRHVDFLYVTIVAT